MPFCLRSQATSCPWIDPILYGAIRGYPPLLVSWGLSLHSLKAIGACAMEWTKADDAALFGESAEDALRHAEAVRAMGIWDAGLAMRCATGDGLHAWLWVTKAGTLSVLCVCDDGGGFAGRDYVPIAELVAAPWPRGWVTKRRVAPAALDPCVVGGFVFGTMGRDGILCIASAVAADGTLERVIVRDGAPDVEAEALGARKWFGMTKWPIGVAELWRRQWTKGDYRNLCRWCGLFEKNAKTKADRAAKRAKPSKP